EASLRLARGLLDRAQPADSSAAAARLAVARELLRELPRESADAASRLCLLGAELDLLSARARLSVGDAAGGLEALAESARSTRSTGLLDLCWRAEAAAGKAERERGADFAARRRDIEAVEILEAFAMRCEPAQRAGFWSDGRRESVRRRASAATGRSEAAPPSPEGPLSTLAERLLEILKRLASEHDRDRLLERITDSAVELSGAERGIVLLVTEQGGLEPHLYRHASISEADPSIAFSRSIAESVLIDGEPLVTLDAQGDRRLTEYLSVHQLMLRSVACVPIRADGEVLGVLYLEHRLRAGRFQDADLELLLAFADQAAIALRNASLLERLDQRGRELERANAELRQARDEVASRLDSQSVTLEQTRLELEDARRRLVDAPERYGIVGKSSAMAQVFAILDRVAARDVPVVLQGESGTGKELVAQAIHRASGRSKGSFVAVNCAAIPEALLESEMFGHVKGAFTGAERDRAGLFERASGGTLFLDEIGDMPAKMQVGLLRALAEGKVSPVGSLDPIEVDVRVVCATQRPLRELVAEGRFREDLYYRLEVVVVPLPPLRERRQDIPLLADHFLARIARDGGGRRRMSRGAIERLMSHPLRGNVRQLEHLLLNASVMGTGDVVLAEDLALDGPTAVVQGGMPEAAGFSDPAPVEAPAVSHADFKAEERRRILEALDQNGWNRARAARALGMARRTFYRRLKEHEIL
ncbi:MAG: GAF domain-containing protein, partial [Deltaproteobacteria bacterium]|nr:GAF domain-containing protein [Deltaproteobacteria bacterium]